MNGYLVDTDWIADYLKGKEYAIKALSPLIGRRLVAVSIVTYAELYEGVLGAKQREKRLEQLSDLIVGIKVFGIDLETAELFAQERSRLRREGRILENFDLLIGATALRHGVELVTNNVSHFQRIEGLQIVSQLSP